MTIHPQPWGSLGVFGGTFFGAIGFGAMAVTGWNNGGIGHVAAHLFGVLALVSLLCAVQSLVWAVRKIATLDLRPDSLIVYLTGWHAVQIQDHEVARIVLTPTAQLPIIVGIELVNPLAVRRSLSFLDRCYFDYSKKFVGCGLSYNVSLSSEDFAQFYHLLRTRFGDRVEGA